MFKDTRAPREVHTRSDRLITELVIDSGLAESFGPTAGTVNIGIRGFA
jgi:hypothetical protein